MTQSDQDQDILEQEPLEDAGGKETQPEGETQAEEETQFEAPTAGRKGRNWATVIVAILAAILALCFVLVCLVGAVAFFTRGDEVPPTLPPVATAEMPQTPTAPTGAYIRIDEPIEGALLDIGQPIGIGGMGAGLPEGNVVVQVLDAKGNVLAQQPTTIQAPDAGTGGEGPWFVEVEIKAEPGTAGQIYAFAPSPRSGSIIASDKVRVSLGSTPAVPVYIKIEEPVEGAVLDLSQPVTIRGMGGGLPEGNVVVRVLDASDNVLVEQPTIVQAPDAGAGGEGLWSVQVTIEAEPGTAGRIHTFAPSPKDGSILASDQVQVSLGRTPAAPAFLEIAQPAEGTLLDISQPVAVNGVGGGLPEGNVVVQAVDAQGTVLAQQATTLEGRDVATGGSGTWSVQLLVNPPPGTPGRIVAFAPMPDGSGSAASAVVNVAFGEQVPGLEGITWILSRTLAGTEITALFENGQLRGSAGCNDYSANYLTTLGISDNAITISNVTATDKLCEESITEQETRYLSVLEAAQSYTIEGDRLTIYYPGGALVYTSR